MIKLLESVKEFSWCLFMLVDLVKNSSTIADVVVIIDFTEDSACVFLLGFSSRIDVFENLVYITISVVIVDLVEDLDYVVCHCIAKVNFVEHVVDIGALFLIIDLVESINDIEWILVIIDLTKFVHDVRLCLDCVDLVENIHASLDLSVLLLRVGITVFD